MSLYDSHDLATCLFLIFAQWGRGGGRAQLSGGSCSDWKHCSRNDW